jgi:hypothetical protein
MKDLLLDIRYALRGLWKSPAFTLVATLTLMLGIGANILVFGVVNAVLLRPLGVSEPENLYELRLKPWTNWKLLTTSYPAFEDYRQRNTTFSGLAGYDGYSGGRLRWGDTVKSVSGYSATGNYFDLLGVQPEVGRFFHEADVHGPKSAPYMVLSDRLWRSAFNADPGVVGTTVRLGKDQFTVLGVAPARFHGTERFVWPDYWIPVVNHFDAKYPRSNGPPFNGAVPAQTWRDTRAGRGKSQCDRSPVGKRVSNDRHGSAAAADPSGTLRRRRRPHPRVSLLRGRACSAGAARGVRESGQPVCGARDGSQPGTGTPCRPGSEPVALGAAAPD